MVRVRWEGLDGMRVGCDGLDGMRVGCDGLDGMRVGCDGLDGMRVGWDVSLFACCDPTASRRSSNWHAELTKSGHMCLMDGQGEWE